MVKKHTLWSWKDIVNNMFKGQLRVLMTKLFMDFMLGFVEKMNVWNHYLFEDYGVVSGGLLADKSCLFCLSELLQINIVLFLFDV